MEEGIKISASAIENFNAYIQADKPIEDQQYSFEKLGIEDWEIREITGRELLEVQSFVETSGVVSPAYAFWKLCGRNVTLNDVVNEVRERTNEIPLEAKPWIKNILPENYNPSDMEEKIKNGEIDPPLLFFPKFMNKDLKTLGLLNLGNILDGNHRLLDIANWLKDKDPEYVDNFKLTVFVGKVDVIKYMAFNLHYITEPWLNNAKKYLGKDYDKVDRENVMNFYERWSLFLQRIGYHQYNNDREI